MAKKPKNDNRKRKKKTAGADHTLGGRIQMAREARGLTAAQLARRSGVLVKTLNNWESDRSEPRANQLQMLAGVLNVPPLWLLGGDIGNFDIDFDVSLDETADLASKVERLIKLHERMSQLLFEVQSEVRRLQTEIENDVV